MTPSEMVREFHLRFGLPAFDVPTVPLVTRRYLRYDLIREELMEFALETVFEDTGPGILASSHNAATLGKTVDLARVAHELADLLYVVYGAAHEYGIDLDAVVAEVHAANMRKLWPDGTVHRRADGKILKPDGFVPADVAAVLARQGVPQ